ncbi:MAG: hypothetical protein ACRD18_12655 [Terriglobia bacterium]
MILDDDYKPPKSLRATVIVVVVALILIAFALAWLTQPRRALRPVPFTSNPASRK